MAYHIIFTINEFDLLWVPIFLVLGIYFLYGTKFPRNEGIDICFIVEYVLLDRNFDFVGGYLVVTARYLVVATVHCSFSGGYCSLLVVTGRYRSLLLVPTFSMNECINNMNVQKKINSNLSLPWFYYSLVLKKWFSRI